MYGMNGWNKEIPGGDTISRAAAIDAARKCAVKEVTPAYMLIDKAEVMTELMKLPSAQPERKTGRWIIKDNPGTGWYRVTCSECGEDVASIAPCIGFYPNAKVTWDYCPNCGAAMREVDDERSD